MGIDVRSLRSTELGNATHVVIEHDAGVAVVVDPVRDVGQYLDLATRESVGLAWALETHVHNDFVSGARELVASAGVRLGASGDAGLRYPYERLGDGDEIEVGSWRLRVLATPGHTPEHVAYVLVDPTGEPQALFSGGALMVGTAARTDLFGPALSWRFAHDLERTLKEKILELPDHVVVYPTHGGGSFCAAGAGTEMTTTIGAERAANPLTTARSSRQFVIRALTARTYPPTTLGSAASTRPGRPCSARRSLPHPHSVSARSTPGSPRARSSSTCVRQERFELRTSRRAWRPAQTATCRAGGLARRPRAAPRARGRRRCFGRYGRHRGGPGD